MSSVVAKLSISELAEQLVVGPGGDCSKLIELLDACSSVAQRKYTTSAHWKSRHETMVQRTVFKDRGCIIGEQACHMLECIITESRKP